MIKIKSELGPNAIVISKRKVKKPGFRGLFSGRLLEVTAAVENSSDDLKESEQFLQKKTTEFARRRV